MSLLQEVRQKLRQDEDKRSASMGACETVVNEFKETCRVDIDRSKRSYIVFGRNHIGAPVYLFGLEVNDIGHVKVTGSGVLSTIVDDISKFDLASFIHRVCKVTGVQP
jgi:hypothetical protein